MLAPSKAIPSDVAVPAAGVRALAVLGAAITLAAVGGGLALGDLAGGSRFVAGGPATLALSVGVFGALILWLQPRNRLGAALLATGVGFGLGVLASGTLEYAARRGGVPRWLEQGAFAWIWVTAAFNASWTLVILWFPDGIFPSTAWRRYFLAGTVVNIALAAVLFLFGPGVVYDFFSGTQVPAGIHGPFASEAFRPLVKIGDLILLFPLAALAGLAQRYRGATPVVRQQIKWLLVPAAAGILLQLTRLPLDGGGATAGAIGSVLSMLGQPVTVVGVAIGILRYRLWEIEVVVSRALVYAVLWAVLTAVMLVPALAAGLLVGGSDAVAAVGLALVVTVVFHPARTRLERLAERVVYRRARPHVLLTGFWETLRSTVELGLLGPLVAGVVRDGLGVQWAGVWLYVESPGSGTLRPLGVAGAEPGPAVLLSAATAEHLGDSPGLVLASGPAEELEPLWPEPPAAVVPLVGGDGLVGLLACGQRRGDALGAVDFELLELLARECALRLRNLRLEAQLRERLAQIEAQAEELVSSRQRLVGAQDEERRRIERDLHDGVQQQLVSLAVRLQRAAAAGSEPLLADLALEAEQAIFALQEFGRGIFPSVLADQGLPAALRTQAARVPLAIQVEVDPELVGRRFEREVEAALYFVALEALTNATKHAPEASVSVWLRAESGEVVLEVADNGRGFDGPGSAGAGLQNMADRIAAIGGKFELEMVPGQGTCARATVRAAPVEPAQLRAADSRR